MFPTSPAGIHTVKTGQRSGQGTDQIFVREIVAHR
jgi:hypothetical protein